MLHVALVDAEQLPKPCLRELVLKRDVVRGPLYREVELLHVFIIGSMRTDVNYLWVFANHLLKALSVDGFLQYVE